MKKVLPPPLCTQHLCNWYVNVSTNSYPLTIWPLTRNQTAQVRANANNLAITKSIKLIKFVFFVDTFPQRPHYVKVTAQRGQVFRLLAVFEDDKHDSSTNSNKSNSTLTTNSISGGQTTYREKEKGRYVQLLTESRQIVYVSLTAKGKFYEIEPTTPQIFQKTSTSLGIGGSSGDLAAKPFNPICIHRIGQIIHAKSELPITIRFISGPQGTGNIVPEVLTITKVSTENIIVACPIEDVEARSPLHLRKLNVTGDMQFMKCFLGFENEQKMFSNPNIQNILKFCQINVDNFLRLVEFEHLISNTKNSGVSGSKPKSDGGLKILKPLNFLRREKSNIAHEKEDSIIFLSKNDLENMDNKDANQSDKLKVFQSTKKKWFRNLKSSASKTNSFSSLDIQSKRMSLDRYQDVSKLLQERFGDNETNHLSRSNDNNHPVVGRPSSEIGQEPRNDHADLRQKSMSLQDMDTRCEYSNKPDLVRVEFHQGNNDHDQAAVIDDEELADASIVVLSNQQSFITEKLFNEFHVKTKQHSKSSSQLHHLLHFAVPQKMNVNETTRKKDEIHGAISANQSNVISEIEIAEQYPMMMGQSSSYDDDLPYSSVRDSLVMDDSLASGGATESACQMETYHNTVQNEMNDPQRHENIYSEICSDAINPLVSNRRCSRNSAIRISVKASTSAIGVGRRSNAHLGDNIYNTLN